MKNLVSSTTHKVMHGANCFTVYVDEYKTVYRITLHQCGWAFPSLLEYRVAKHSGVTAAIAICAAFAELDQRYK